VIRGAGKETTGNDVKSLKTKRQNFGDARTKIGEREPILFSSLRTSLLSPQSTIASTIDLYLIPGTFVGSNSTYTSLSSIKGRDKAVGKISTQAFDLAPDHESFFKCVQLRLFMGGGLDSELAKVLPVE
jgi:hypothetical protein